MFKSQRSLKNEGTIQLLLESRNPLTSTGAPAIHLMVRTGGQGDGKLFGKESNTYFLK